MGNASVVSQSKEGVIWYVSCEEYNCVHPGIAGVTPSRAVGLVMPVTVFVAVASPVLTNRRSRSPDDAIKRSVNEIELTSARSGLSLRLAPCTVKLVGPAVVGV